MMRSFFSVFTVLSLLFSACQEDTAIADFDCLAVEDLGFVSFNPPGKELFLYDYSIHKQLIFQNSSGETAGFYATPLADDDINDFSAYRDTILTSTSRWCNENMQTTYNYEQENYSAFYTASWGNRSIGFNVNFLAELKEDEFDPSVSDDYDYTMFFQVNYGNTSEFRIGISETYEKNTLVKENNDWTVFYKDVRWNDVALENVFVAEKKSGDFTFAYSPEEGMLGFIDEDGMTWTFSHYGSFENEDAYNFQLPDPNGNEITLEELSGELILLDFWASWCSPCIEEIEATLKPLHEAYASEGLTIVSISIDNDLMDWENGLETLNMPWLQLVSPGGFETPLFLNYEVYGIPTVYIIDQEKRIITNTLRGEELAAYVEDYFN